MTNEPDNLVLELLRAIRGDITELKRDSLATTMQLSAMGQQLAGLTAAVYAGHSEVDSLKSRVERIERRLNIAEG